MTTIDIKRVGEAYAKIEAALTALQIEYESKRKPLEDDLLKVSNILTEHAKESNVDTLIAGPIKLVRKIKRVFNVINWDELYTFIRETDRLDMLQRKVKGSEIESYLEDRKELPPGVAVDQIYQTTIKTI